MKHFFVLLVLAVAAYAGWQLARRLGQRQGLQRASRHGLRLGLVVAALLGLLALAYYLPSIPLL